MNSLLKAELRKLLTIRSTYVFCIIALVLASFIGFWVLGYKGAPGNTTIAVETIKTVGGMTGLFMAFAGILLVTHEYRYNTIVYTLTASNSRGKVLLAKVLMATLFGLAVTFIITVIALLLTWFGVSIRDTFVVPQQFYGDVIWRTLFSVAGFTLAGLLFGVLFRHVVGAIITLSIAPATIEGLLTLLLKENGKYLPFSALDQVQGGTTLAPGKAAFVFSFYLIIGWLLAWFLFLRRDAN